jgi:hypothetical protein
VAVGGDVGVGGPGVSVGVVVSDGDTAVGGTGVTAGGAGVVVGVVGPQPTNMQTAITAVVIANRYLANLPFSSMAVLSLATRSRM